MQIIQGMSVYNFYIFYSILKSAVNSFLLQTHQLFLVLMKAKLNLIYHF